jgi:hypothetical protein
MMDVTAMQRVRGQLLEVMGFVETMVRSLVELMSVGRGGEVGWRCTVCMEMLAVNTWRNRSTNWLKQW